VGLGNGHLPEFDISAIRTELRELVNLLNTAAH
jgi:hypothetical protein